MSKPGVADIPSLTGLRFFAAFAIVCNHLLLGFVPRSDANLAPMLSLCGVLGMNAFFILSGFIIHYNYRSMLETFSPRSIYDFISARVARLYPLFICSVVLDVLTSGQALAHALLKVLLSLVFFFTMTQSWFFLQIDGGSLPYIYPRASITWSISTEMLMYCFYPVILWFLLRDRLSPRLRVACLVGGTVVISLALRWITNNPGPIDALGVAMFGEGASYNQAGANSFYYWLVFLSPYTRIFEFLIGAGVAHVFLSMRDQPIGPWEKRVMPVVSAAAVAFILLSFLPPQAAVPGIPQTVTTLGYYPALAVIIFACARYPRALASRLFSVPVFVQWGEWSYSIYLFHIYLYGAVVFGGATGIALFAQIVVVWTVLLVCARVLYTYIEMPGRRHMRKMLANLYSRLFIPRAPSPAG